MSAAAASDVARIIGRWAEPLERELRRSIPPTDRSGLYTMLRYHLGWVDAQGQPAGGARGKQLRPTLLLLAAEAAGGDAGIAVPAAAAVELLHNFSLIHDDIQDRSDERHGKTVVWSIWGIAQAINAGDAMHATAARAALRCAEVGASVADTLEVAAMLHDCCLRLVEGQYLDLEFERRDDVSLDEYFAMIEGKTGALIVTCIEIGALLGGGRPKLEEWRRFGWHLGRAFQIVDDGLGVWGDPKVTGKPAADDVVKGKRAMPFLVACQRLPQDDAARLRELYGRAESAGEAVDLLTRSGAWEAVRAAAVEHLEEALRALGAADATGRGAEDLRALARFVVERDR